MGRMKRLLFLSFIDYYKGESLYQEDTRFLLGFHWQEAGWEEDGTWHLGCGR